MGYPRLGYRVVKKMGTPNDLGRLCAVVFDGYGGYTVKPTTQNNAD
jgi:hypothetical protein